MCRDIYILEPIVTKFETCDYVADIYHHKNFGSIRPGVIVPHMRNIHPKPSNVYFTFSQSFRKSTDALVGPIFTFKTSYDVVLRKVVPFGGEKI